MSVRIVHHHNGRLVRDALIASDAPPSAPAVTAPSQEQLAEQGRAAWLWLHREAHAGTLTPARLTAEFEPMIPHFGCGCLAGWKAVLARIPFRLADQWRWSVDVHNAVNAEVAAKNKDATKRQWTYDEALAVLA